MVRKGRTATDGSAGSSGGAAGGNGSSRLRLRRQSGRNGRVDRRDEAEAALPDRQDMPLVLAGIAERLAGRLDAARKRGVRYGAALPDRVDDLLLADEASGAPREQHDQREHLRLDGHGRAVAAQFLRRLVQFEGAEAMNHFATVSLVGESFGENPANLQTIYGPSPSTAHPARLTRSLPPTRQPKGEKHVPQDRRPAERPQPRLHRPAMCSTSRRPRCARSGSTGHGGARRGSFRVSTMRA